VADLIRRAQQAAGTRQILGVGVCVNEPSDRGGSWNELRTALDSQVNLPVLLVPRAAALALAERWFGAANADDLLCIELGRSIALGILLEGEPFRSSSGMAANFAHVCVDPNGPACPCGGRGCVSSFCSAPALMAFAHEAGANGEAATVEALTAMAAAGSVPARAAFDRMGQYLALAVNNLVQLFEPALVVLAGTTTAAAEFYTPALERHLRRGADSRAVPLLVSQLGGRAGALGAAAVVVQAALTPGAS
jgi:predicted NBD/HSP70 family sugar kinase